MADALVWQLIRSNNSFLVKRGKTRRDGSVQLSSEKGNLLGVNSSKYSGLANSATVDVSLGDKKVILSKKDGKIVNKPKKASVVSVFKPNPKQSLKELKSLADSGLRGDLLSAASIRYKKLNRAVKIKMGLTKAPRVSKARGTK